MSSKKTGNKLYWLNTFTMLGGTALMSGISFLGIPILIRLLGDEQYGLYRITIFGFAGYISLIQMGLNSGVQRFFSDAYHNANIQKSNQVLGIAYRIYSALGIFAAVISISAVWWLGPRIAVRPGRMLLDFPEYQQGFAWLMVASGFVVATQFFNAPCMAIFAATGRYIYHQLVNATTQFGLYFITIVLLLFFNKKVEYAAAGTLIAFSIGLILSIRLTNKAFPDIAIPWRSWDFDLFQRIFKYSIQGMLISIGPIIVYRTPEILISIFPGLGIAKVTEFSIAAVLMTQLRSIGSAFSLPLFPIAAKLKAQNDSMGLKQLLWDGTLRCLLIWCAIAIPLAVFAGKFLSLWVGPAYEPVKVLVWALLLGNLGALTHYPLSQILMAAGRIKWLGYSQIVMAIVSLVLMVVSLFYTDFGMIGIAFSVSIPTALRGCIFAVIYACTQLEIPIANFSLGILIRFLGLSIVAAVLAMVAKNLYHAHHLITLLLQMGLVALLTFVFGAITMLNIVERKRLFALFRFKYQV